MKKVFDYSQFVNELNSYSIKENLKENLIVSKYLDGKIKENHIDEFLYNDLTEYLKENNIILEGIDIQGLLNKGKEAIMDWFFGVLVTVIDKGKKAADKVVGILNSIVNVIMKFVKKHPKLVKIMVVLIIIVVIMVISSHTAAAATSGTPMTDVELQQLGTLMDATIGYVGHMMDTGQAGSAQVQELANSLLEIKKQMLTGNGDMSGISEQLKQTSQAAFNYITTFTDSEVSQYAKKGVDFVHKYATMK